MARDPDEPKGLKKDDGSNATDGAEFCDEIVTKDTGKVEFEEADDA